MKKIILLVLICFAQNSFSQSKNTQTTNPDKDNTIYNAAGIDVKPEFPGGMEKLHKFINQNYIIPKDKPADIKGKVYVTFIIEKDGSLSEIKTIKDIGYGTGAEAIRIMKKCPKWIPGKINNNPIRVLYSIPIYANTK